MAGSVSRFSVWQCCGCCSARAGSRDRARVPQCSTRRRVVRGVGGVAVVTHAVVVRPRFVELDRVRGLAIALMLVDHLSYLGGLQSLRLTLGRLAMPLFFVLAGALVTRLTSRHALAFGLGLALPLAAPWAGAPNVLVVFAFGAAALVLLERLELSPAWLVAFSLAVAANRWEVGSTSYDPAALVALMALGQLIGFGWATSLGARLEGLGLDRLGRRPLLWYVGNVLAIQGVIWWVLKLS